METFLRALLLEIAAILAQLAIMQPTHAPVWRGSPEQNRRPDASRTTGSRGLAHAISLAARRVGRRENFTIVPGAPC